MLTKPIMRALVNRDKGVALKLFCRLTRVTNKNPLGPLLHSEWLELWNERYNSVGGWPHKLTWDREFNVLWQSAGHMALLPAIEDGVAHEDHTYTHLEFMDTKFPLENDTIIKGSYIIDCNWCHWSAVILDPTQPWNRIPSWSVIKEHVLKALAPPLLTIHPCPNKTIEDSAESAGSSATTLQLGDQHDEASLDLGPETPTKMSPSPSPIKPYGHMESSKGSTASSQSLAQTETPLPDDEPPSPTFDAVPQAAAVKGATVVACPGIRKRPAPQPPQQQSKKKQAALESLAARASSSGAPQESAL
jgi:hypothetical protein